MMFKSAAARKKRGLETHGEEAARKRRFCSSARSKYILNWLRETPSFQEIIGVSHQHRNDEELGPDFVPPSIPSDIAADSDANGDNDIEVSIPSTVPTLTQSTKTTPESLVNFEDYRDKNLRENKIEYRRERDGSLPDHVAQLWAELKSLPTDHTLFSMARMGVNDVIFQILKTLQDDSEREGEVSSYMTQHVFPQQTHLTLMGWGVELKACQSSRFQKCAVPGASQLGHIRVSGPKPDVAYGYGTTAFSSSQLSLASFIEPEGGRATPTWYYPFLVVEVKGVGGSRRVAINQCMGGSATCVNIIKCLNRLAESYGVGLVDGTSFSIAVNPDRADIFVTWEDGDSYRMQRLHIINLNTTEDLQILQDIVRSILRWGREKRLPAIKKAMDNVWKAKSKVEKANAKQRRPLSSRENDKKRSKRRA